MKYRIFESRLNTAQLDAYTVQLL